MVLKDLNRIGSLILSCGCLVGGKLHGTWDSSCVLSKLLGLCIEPQCNSSTFLAVGSGHNL